MSKRRAKILVIYGCGGCPWCEHVCGGHDDYYYCNHHKVQQNKDQRKREIPGLIGGDRDLWVFTLWCPLPDRK